jgi:hypothetical protein
MKNFVYSTMIVGLTVLSFGVMLFLACGSPDKLGSGNGGGGAAGTPTIKLDGSPAGSKGGSGGGGNSGITPTGDANCGSTTSSTNHMPADVLLVLDRSGSMDYSTTTDSNCSGGAGCTARWPALTSAVDATLTSTAGSISWGLKLYSTPGGSNCAVDPGVEVPISSGSVSAIQSQIGGVSPQNNTPTAQAIDAATAYLKTVTDPNNKVILLATDGEPNCKPGSSSQTTNVDGTLTAITNAKAAGFPVYVIGIGPSVGNLDNFASAGGTGHYYPASSPADLASAFASISQTVTTCTFVAPNPPPDPNNIAVYLDKNLVQKDASNGWSFGSNNQTIVLNGSSCAKITSGSASNVQILFGCPGDTQPPPSTIP